MIEDELFSNGYRGEIIVGVAKRNFYPYIEHVAKTAAGKSSIRNKIHFTLDEESASTNKQLLDFSFNKNVVFSTGSSACLPTHPSDDERELAAINKVTGMITHSFYTLLLKKLTQTSSTRSKSIIEAKEQYVKYVESSQ